MTATISSQCTHRVASELVLPSLLVWLRLQHLPFFALSSRFFQGLHSSFYRATMVYDNALTKALISIQHYTFLPMMLVARFGEGLALHALACTSSTILLAVLKSRTLSLSRSQHHTWAKLNVWCPRYGGMQLCSALLAGFYAMTSFHLLARDRPSLYKPFEVAAFMGFFAW